MFGFKKAGQVVKDAQKEIDRNRKNDELAKRRGQKNQGKK